MPTVPYLESPQVQQEPLPGRALPRVDTDVSAQDFGSGLAQGLSEVGAAGAEQEAKLKQQNDQLRVIDANTQLEAAKTSMLYGQSQPDGTRTGGAFSLHGTAAINMPATILPEYDKVSQQIASTLTPDQQRMFQAHIALGKNELNTQLNRYEYEESNRLSDQIYTNGAQQTITNATVGWRDPAAIMKSRLDLKGLVQMQGDRQGWSDEQRAEQLAKVQAEMHFNVVDRMLADGSPNAALAYFKGIRDTGELTGEQSRQLGAQIDSAFRENQAQNQTSILSRLRDVSAAAMNGQAIPPSSMPSRAEVLAAFPQDGDQRLQAVQKDIRMGTDLKSMVGMTPQQIGALVASYRPTGVTGAADQYARYGEIGDAANKALAARSADPRQYQIDNSLGSNALDFSDMKGVTAELRTRLAAQSHDAQTLGGYVPLLTKPEAAQLGQRLETQPPPARLAALASLSSGIGDDKGFQELMRQVMPSSPVTAIVGSQLAQVTNPNTAPVWFDHQYTPDPADQTRILAGEQLINPQKAAGGGGGLPSEETKNPGLMGRVGRLVGGKILPGDGGPTEPGLRETFSDASKDLFRDRPELQNAYYTAFKGAYAQLLAEKGDYSGVGDPSAQKQALKMVLGNVTTYNGAKVAVPIGMDPTRFESLFKAAVNVKAQAMGAKGTPEDWQQALAGAKPLEIGGLGSGRYMLLNGNAQITNPDGRGVFIVDLRNQYMAATGAKPDSVDLERQAQEQRTASSGPSPQAPAPVQPASILGGDNGVGRTDIGVAPTFKTPPAPRGGGRGGGQRHPSQGAPET
jgi:hypothetical protein